ncbi:MAG: hypothetical protein CR997_04120 [Acidobacteria bacterium]|nr:MAG: hypothetical protein CR997_04120 [Acidobacteriota bacterium]
MGVNKSKHVKNWLSPFLSCTHGILLWCLLIFALFHFACMDLTLKGKIEKDGRITIAMNLKAVDQVLQNAIKESSSRPDSFLFLRKNKLIKRVDKLGGLLSVYRNELSDGIRTVQLEIQLLHPEDLNKLSLLDPMSLNHQGNGVWHWKFGDVPLGTALGAMDETSLLQQIELLSPILKGLKLDIQIEAPEVAKTNLQKNKGNLYTYSMDFDSQIAGLQTKGRLVHYERLLEPKHLIIPNLPLPRPESNKAQKKQ